MRCTFFLFLTSSIFAGPVLQTDKDSLWTVTFDEEELPGKWRITFGQTGNFIVEKYILTQTEVRLAGEGAEQGRLVDAWEGGHWRALADGGIAYYKRGWKENGYQLKCLPREVRRSADPEAKTLVYESVIDTRNGQTLATGAFRFEQTVRVLSDGLALDYQITAQQQVDIQAMGAYIYLPAQLYAGKTVSVDAHQSRPLPEAILKGSLLWASGQNLTLAGGTDWEMRVVLPKKVPFLVDDLRTWNIANYRILANHLDANGKMFAPGEKLNVSFELKLNKHAGQAEVVKQSRVATPACVPLTDDRKTAGDWHKEYGSHGYLLCAMDTLNRAVTGGSGFGLGGPSFHYYPGTADGRVYMWTGGIEDDLRVLWNPGTRRRHAANWNDGGWRKPIGEEANLCVDLDVPDGLFVLSHYSYDCDWIQHRQQRVTLRRRSWDFKENKDFKKGDLLASSDATDLLHGLYSRFMVKGPLKLQVEFERGLSPSTVLCGIFWDKIRPPVRPKDNALLPVFERVVKASEAPDALSCYRSLRDSEALVKGDGDEAALLRAFARQWDSRADIATRFGSSVEEEDLRAEIVKLLRSQQIQLACEVGRKHLEELTAIPSSESIEELYQLAGLFLSRSFSKEQSNNERPLNLEPDARLAEDSLKAWLSMILRQYPGDTPKHLKEAARKAKTTQKNTTHDFIIEAIHANYGYEALEQEDRWRLAQRYLQDPAKKDDAQRVLSLALTQESQRTAELDERALNSLISIAYSLEDWAKAEAITEALIDKFPDGHRAPIGACMLSRKLSSAGHLERALQFIQKARTKLKGNRKMVLLDKEEKRLQALIEKAK